jgi:hypothetical protein
LATAFNENKEVVDALDEAITNKANKEDLINHINAADAHADIRAAMPTIILKNW